MLCPLPTFLPERFMASRAQLSTSLCRSSVKVPLRLEAMAVGWLWGAWLFTAAPTVLVLLVPWPGAERLGTERAPSLVKAE